MKTYTPVQTKAVSAITCDRCKTRFVRDEPGWHEIQSIEFIAGYDSIFGDGNIASIDLCQDCLQQSLGQWLQIRGEPPIAED
jgi:hypothetical protein